MEVTKEFKEKVVLALKEARENFTGPGGNKVFAGRYGLNHSIYTRIMGGELDKVLAADKWVHLGRQLGVNMHNRKWNIARTDVFNMIEEDVLFCKEFSKARICVDDCGIGKTFTAKYLARTIPNVFYVDASQAKTRQLFIRLIAKAVGVEESGKFAEVKAQLKYYLQLLDNPIVIIDEIGDVDHAALLEVKELWNATEGTCGWYLIGADGLKAKIEKGIRTKKVGYREIFSRFSESFTRVVPYVKEEKRAFYRKLITQVLEVNMEDTTDLPLIVNHCLTENSIGQYGGLRRAESLLILKEKEKQAA